LNTHRPYASAHPVGAHLVVYVEIDADVLIVRVRYGAEDGQSDQTD
jgi:plasmid stabilization system protein ParE